MKKTLTSLLFCSMFMPALGASQDQNTQTEFNNAYRNYRALIDEGKPGESLEYARRALELGRQLYDEENQTTAALSHNYALNLFETGRFEESVQEFEHTEAAYEQVYGEQSDGLAAVLFDAGRAHANAGQNTRAARQKFRASRDIVAALYGEDSLEFATLSLQAGIIMLDEANLRDADRFIEDSLEIYEQDYGPQNPNTALANFYLGKFHFGNGRNNRAAEYFSASIDGLQRATGEENRTLMLTARGFLVRIYEQGDETELATEQLLLIGAANPPLGEGEEAFPIYATPPEYPMAAVRNNSEGEVLIAFDLDASGTVQNPRVIESTDSVFEAPSLEVIEEFRFAPSFENGSAVPAQNLRYRFNYRLRPQ